MDREKETAVTCDGRLFNRWAAATGNALLPTADRRVCQTSRDVDEAEHSRRLVNNLQLIISTYYKLAQLHGKCLRPKLRPKLWGQDRGQNFGLKATLASRTSHLWL